MERETGNERLLLHWTLPGEWIPSPPDPPAETDRVFSPAGTYFAIVDPSAPTRIYASATGRLVHEIEGRDEVFFLDDRRVLSSAHYGTELSVVELPSGKRLAHVEMRLGSDHFFLGHAPSPDGTHVTVLERHGEDTDLDLLVWKVGERTVLRRAIPKAVCEGTCTVTWLSKTELSLVGSEGATTREGRLDLASKVLRVMPLP